MFLNEWLRSAPSRNSASERGERPPKSNGRPSPQATGSAVIKHVVFPPKRDDGGSTTTISRAPCAAYAASGTAEDQRRAA